MTLEEAIKILHQDLGAATYDNHLRLYEAQKLGIEALERELERRTYLPSLSPLLLPGETEK